MDKTLASNNSLDLEELRLAVYREFVARGRPPSNDALATSLGVSADDVRTGLLVLHEQRHVVLDTDGRIVMAHPFAVCRSASA